MKARNSYFGHVVEITNLVSPQLEHNPFVRLNKGVVANASATLCAC